MIFEPNVLFHKMAKAYSKAKKNGQRLTICNEGGSRSGKTFDTFALILAICSYHINEGLDIYILRDTLTRCKDYTLKDFIKYLKICQVYDGNNYHSPQKPTYELFGNNIYFRGLDDEKNAEGYPSDILFINEILETKKSKVEGLIMRCRMLVITDWNPKVTKHWIFPYEGRKNVFWTKSTYLNNKHLEQTIIDEIEGYNPAIEENVTNGTADAFRWKVYGLGVRADQEGSVFNDSQLNKFDIEDIKDDIETAIKLSWGDVADQGIDYFCQPFGLMIAEKVYITDVIFTPKDSHYSIPLAVELLNRIKPDKTVYESNNQGLMYTKLLLKTLDINECKLKEIEYTEGYKSKYWHRRIAAIPNTKNKHSRIVIQAETNIIKNFYFLKHRKGMYADFYDFLTSYKHDKSFKKDDAPDGLAGLSVLAQKYQ